MTVESVATNQCKKPFKFELSIFRRRFNSSKCKTMAKMALARIKLLRNKREMVIRQMRRDIAMLLENKQDATARIRVEHVIREQNIMAANEFIENLLWLDFKSLPSKGTALLI